MTSQGTSGISPVSQHLDTPPAGIAMPYLVFSVTKHLGDMEIQRINLETLAPTLKEAKEAMVFLLDEAKKLT